MTATEIAANAVGSSEIAANAVGSSEIAANAVGASEVADNSLGTAEIAPDAIESDEIKNGEVHTEDLADDAVDSAKIANGAVATADLADDAVTAAKLAQMGAANGQYLRWDGSDWGPAAVSSSQWTTTGNDIYYTTGQVGVGTTSPDADLDVHGFMEIFGADTMIRLDVGTSNDQGFIGYEDGVGMWINDESGTLRLSSQSSDDVYLRHYGNDNWQDVHGAGYTNHSARASKKLIQPLPTNDIARCLEQVRKLTPTRYLYRWEDDGADLRFGLIADEAPAEILRMTADGEPGVDLYAYSTLLAGAVRQLATEKDALEEEQAMHETEIAELRAQVADLERLVQQLLNTRAEDRP